jgi:hypothetical protein
MRRLGYYQSHQISFAAFLRWAGYRSGVTGVNRERYQSEAVRFECSDFLSQPPPGGDLLLIKDVLQHLSNACVHDFIRDVLPRFRYAIITNDVCNYEKWPRFGIITLRRQLQEPNIDITDGSSRPLRLDAPLFPGSG